VISAAGALVLLVALWRAGRSRLLDLRTNLRKQTVELRLALDGDEKRIR